MAVGACQSPAGPTNTASAHATGVVVAADGPTAAQVDTFSLRTTDGETLQFRVGRLDVSNGGLSAPHLREHLVSGEAIAVSYYLDGGTRVAVRYIDAP